MAEFETAVIGAGTVGAAIAYGLARLGQRVLLLDGNAADPRAARANFGLVWLQGKGLTMPAYRDITRQSAEAWAGFVDELRTISDVSIEYRRDGGLVFCLGEGSLEARRRLLGIEGDGASANPHLQMLDRAELERRLPKVQLGAEVVGASFCTLDGDTNPLQLLHALHVGFGRLGGTLRGNTKVNRIVPRDGGFELCSGDRRFSAGRLVIAAGLGSAALAQDVGLSVPVRAERGQILVTERLSSFLPLPASGLRQTASGTVMIGATHEDVGLDLGTTASAATKLSQRAIRIIPALADTTVVRQWAGLRILSPDGHPIFAQSPSHPGAFVVLCHSGITLAAYMADTLTQHLVDGLSSKDVTPFHHGRFDVSQAA